MKRRKFITLLGGAAAWPVAARGQQPSKVWRIGFLSSLPRATFGSGLYAGFQQGMRELGYVEGKDFVSEWRSADGKYERLPDLAAELVRLKMDVIVTGLTAGIRPLQQATSRSRLSWLTRLIPSATISLPAWRDRAAISPAWQVPPMTRHRSNWSCWRRLWPALVDAGSRPGNCSGMEEATGAPSSLAVSVPRRLRASGRHGETVMTEPPSPLRMLLSRHTRRREFITLLGGAAAHGRSRRGRSSRRCRLSGSSAADRPMRLHIL